MKPTTILLASVFLAVSSADAALPELAPGVKLKADGKEIDLPVGHLVPWVTDWNGDGKKDLIVGQFQEGRIRLYVNEGTDAEPKFGASRLLEAGGKPIRLDAG